MTATGIDILLRGRDETGPAVQSVLGRLAGLQAGSGNLGGKMGQQMAGQLQATFVQYLGARALDQGLRAAVEAAGKGAGWFEAGVAGASALAEGFKSIPLAGVLGEVLGEAFDSAGALATERAQQAGRKLAADLQGVAQSVEELAATLRRDTLTPGQQRQAEFDRQLAPILRRAADAGESVAPIRDRLQGEFDAAEGRRVARESRAAIQARTLPAADAATRADVSRTEDLLREQRRANELLGAIAARLPTVEAVP